jgi:drug/metabolite transporter (DMT)-like permease
LRGIAHGAAVMLWFFAMARIPISEVTAIGYTTPIFTVVGAVLIFGERIHMRRIIAIIIGFIGILIILRPGFETIEIGSLAQLVAAPCFAISFLFAKKLTNTENSSDTLVMLSIFCTLALMPGALYLWRTPTVTELAWLFLVAVFATAGHYALTKSIANAPLTVTQPFSFLQLVWAILFGYLIFGEVPDVWVCLGAAMIVAVISYMSHREAVASRQQKLQAAASTPV